METNVNTKAIQKGTEPTNESQTKMPSKEVMPRAVLVPVGEGSLYALENNSEVNTGMLPTKRGRLIDRIRDREQKPNTDHDNNTEPSNEPEPNSDIGNNESSNEQLSVKERNLVRGEIVATGDIHSSVGQAITGIKSFGVKIPKDPNNSAPSDLRLSSGGVQLEIKYADDSLTNTSTAFGMKGNDIAFRMDVDLDNYSYKYTQSLPLDHPNWAHSEHPEVSSADNAIILRFGLEGGNEIRLQVEDHRPESRADVPMFNANLQDEITGNVLRNDLESPEGIKIKKVINLAGQFQFESEFTDNDLNHGLGLSSGTFQLNPLNGNFAYTIDRTKELPAPDRVNYSYSNDDFPTQHSNGGATFNKLDIDYNDKNDVLKVKVKVDNQQEAPDVNYLKLLISSGQEHGKGIQLHFDITNPNETILTAYKSNDIETLYAPNASSQELLGTSLSNDNPFTGISVERSGERGYTFSVQVDMKKFEDEFGEPLYTDDIEIAGSTSVMRDVNYYGDGYIQDIDPMMGVDGKGLNSIIYFKDATQVTKTTTLEDFRLMLEDNDGSYSYSQFTITHNENTGEIALNPNDDPRGQ